jgi:hypothetical protein
MEEYDEPYLRGSSPTIASAGLNYAEATAICVA